MAKLVLATTLAAVVACGGCAGSSKHHVSRSDLGTDWPLTVNSGTVACRDLSDGLHVLTFTTGGATYALNGTAASRGYDDITSIWAEQPGTGLRKNITPLTDFAARYC